MADTANITRSRFLITGCSGGGKSTLLEALADLGQMVVREPGRRIIAEERANGGRALPWLYEVAFAERALAMAKNDFDAASPGATFFDRGLIDAAVALEHLTGRPLKVSLEGRRYQDPIIIAPPWPEIYRGDEDRRHGFHEAVEEHLRIERALALLGYSIPVLPKESLAHRVEFVSRLLDQ